MKLPIIPGDLALRRSAKWAPRPGGSTSPSSRSRMRPLALGSRECQEWCNAQFQDRSAQLACYQQYCTL